MSEATVTFEDSANHLCQPFDPDRAISRPIHPFRSAWGCLKWLFWTTLLGLFNCGVSVFDRLNHAPITTVSRRAQRDLEVGSYAPPQNDNLRELTPVSTYAILNIDNCQAESLIEFCQPTVYWTPHKTGEDNAPTRCCFEVEGSSSLSLCSLNGAFDSIGEFGFDDAYNFLGTTSPPYTLLSTYYAASENGLIDDITRDCFISELIQSVIPRNLSDCSDISVPSNIHKMYAWENSKSVECKNDVHSTTKKDTFELTSEIPVCDASMIYPGKLSMSDSSPSPVSSATTQSTTVVGHDEETGQRQTDLDLPGVDRHDQTLAWAMANLHTGENEETCYAGDTPNDRIQRRQSRDKSPVTTINSIRPPDGRSFSTVIPPASQLFDAKDSLFNAEFPAPKPKRSSSLKSQRTPPGTPGQKAVRFADAFGLDLESVRHVFDQEQPPRIPASATFDLDLDKDESIAKIGAKQFSLCFAQPVSSPNFIHRVLLETVCLEDAHVENTRGRLTGTIRLRSLGFEKRVYVRITYNNWATYFDNPASYVLDSHDGATDRFSF
ncbi:unnamed protein product, partial [Dicrocoelium dendriticum]